MRAAAAGYGYRESHDPVFMPIPQRGHVLIGFADYRQRLFAAVRLEVMAGIRNHAHVESDLVMESEHVLDRGRTLPAPERRRLFARRMHMGMPVDDHALSLTFEA